MKIIRLIKKALSYELANDISQKLKRDLPFNNLFGGDADKLREIIPLRNEKLFEIVNLLESGDTHSGVKYKVDLDHNAVYRIINNEIDPRKMRPGKVIKRELGQEWANEWSRQANSINNDEFSIVFSRSPIDVVRMGDHNKIDSCHSPGGDYFNNAIEEAKEGGGIAYIVETEDLNNFLKEFGNDALQIEDIFFDSDRGISGISPISRLRVNRYINEEGDIDIALPVNRTYGNNVAGFLPSLTEWLKDKQSNLIDYNLLDMNSFERTGGSYADISDSDIMTNFFGNNMGVTTDLPNEGGESRVAIFREELDNILAKYEERLNHCDIYANSDIDDGAIYIDAGVFVNFQIYGNILRDTSNKDQEAIRESLRSMSYLPQYIDQIDLEYNEKIDIIDIKVLIRFEMVNNPDDVSEIFDDLTYFEDREYNEAFNNLKELLESLQIISTDSSGTQSLQLDNYEEYFKEKGWEYDIRAEEIKIVIPLPVQLQSSKWDSGFISLRDEIEKIFKESLPKRMREYVFDMRRQQYLQEQEQEQNQDMFNFYKEKNVKNLINSPMWKGEIPVPNYEIYVGKIEKWGIGNKDKWFSVDFPQYEIMRLGTSYFDILFEIYPYITQDIVYGLQKIDREMLGEEEGMRQKYNIEDNENNEDNEDNENKEVKEKVLKEEIANLSWYKRCKVAKAIGG